MFSTNFSNICCSFAQNNVLKNQDGGQDGGHVVKQLLP